MFPCPRSRLRIWSRETGSAVPSRVSLLISILRLNLVLTYGIPPEFRVGVYLFILTRHTPSGQSRVYRVTQLRTDGVPCRVSAGTGPVNLKLVPNECCLGRSPWIIFSGAYLRNPSRGPRRRPFIYFNPPYAIGSVPSLSGHVFAYRWRSLPSVRRHRARKPQACSKRVLPWQVMDQFFWCSLAGFLPSSASVSIYLF